MESKEGGNCSIMLGQPESNILAPRLCCEFHVKTPIATMFVKTLIFWIEKSVKLQYFTATQDLHSTSFEMQIWKI
jgi:hypothetical protein